MRIIKEAKFGILVLVLMQIFLLMNSTTAYSYEVHQTDTSSTNIQIKHQDNSLIKGFLVGLFSIKEIGIVSAASTTDSYQGDVYNGQYKKIYNDFFADTTGLGCCQELKNGAICQNVPSNFANCSSSILPTKCEQVSNCQVGCCYNEEQGLCDVNSPKQKCESDGGKWSSEANCNNLLCQKGCCSIGSNFDFTTERRCQFLSSQAGFQTTNFDQKLDIISCLQKQKEQKTGACVLSLGTCVFGTEAECYQRNGEFKVGKLCSSPELNTTCIKEFSTGCIEGKNEIYWFDSCGNRENIYSSDKNASWNNGLVLNKSQSCNTNNANINSASCGNCNYELGSICAKGTDKKITDGNSVCKSMNCIDENGKERINGESWCVYDGVIGNNSALVGSRDWKRICIDGNITVEPCADFRQEVCAQGSQINDDGKNISLATCRTNRWKNCLAINGMKAEDLPEGKTNQKLCEEDSDCSWNEVKIGDSVQHYCFPEYPTGFDFWSKQGEANSTCSIATQSCTYISDCNGCVANCECITEAFTERMNNFCKSLGDCGGNVNIEGDYTDGGYTIVNAPKLGNTYIARLKELITPTEGQCIALGKATDYASSAWERVKGQGGSGGGTSFVSSAFGGSNLVLFIAGIITSCVDFGLVLIIWLIMSILGMCKTHKTTVKYTCKPWSPPTTNQKCESCNVNDLKPCSEYRCKSLGAACVIQNVNTQNPVCFEDNKGDVTPPVISFGTINESLYKVTTTENGVEIKTIKDDCIPEFTPVPFTINTSEYATCKVEYNRTTSYDEMSSYFGDSNLYDKEHQATYAMMNIDYLNGLLNNDLINDSTKNSIIEKFANMDMYIRCQDNHGNFNTKEFDVRFCVKNGPDLTPPLIIATNPAENSYIKYGESSINATFSIIEPSECKFSYTANKSYDDMENTMACDTGIEDITNYGWQCNATIENLTEKENPVYIKCKDQPWLDLPEYKHLVDDEGRARNTNAQDYVFTVYQSKGVLNISSISPSGIIETGFTPASVTLTAKTEGGAKGNGNSICRYEFMGKNWSDEFRETGTDTHTNIMSELPADQYDLKVTCNDEAGNYAEKQTHFNLQLDNTPPIVTRVYRSGASLEIQTDEQATCAYDYNNCLFNFENGTKMDSAISLAHQANWKPGLTYYIKCKDIWGNYKNDCNIQVSPDVFGE